MRIHGRMMEFIRELISDRRIKVKVGGSTLQNKQTDLGVPQGGVLSVILFLVVTNGIQGNWEMEWMDHFCRRSSYLYYNKKPKGGTARIYQQVRCIGNRERNTLLYKQNGKRRIEKRNKEPMEMEITLNIQCLGITLDSRLNWEEHIDRVRVKVKRISNIIKLVADKKRVGNQKTLNRLYSGLWLPIVQNI